MHFHHTFHFSWFNAPFITHHGCSFFSHYMLFFWISKHHLLHWCLPKSSSINHPSIINHHRTKSSSPPQKKAGRFFVVCLEIVMVQEQGNSQVGALGVLQTWTGRDIRQVGPFGRWGNLMDEIEKNLGIPMTSWEWEVMEPYILIAYAFRWLSIPSIIIWDHDDWCLGHWVCEILGCSPLTLFFRYIRNRRNFGENRDGHVQLKRPGFQASQIGTILTVTVTLFNEQDMLFSGLVK